MIAHLRRTITPPVHLRHTKPTPKPDNRFVEPLEKRRLLCALHTHEAPVELRPDLVGTQTTGGPEVAGDIVWVNRGLSSDGFSVFGAQAETARKVVDAVIVAFERMIGSFNYSDGSANFNLTVQTSGNHNGASAGLGQVLGGKPKSGTITMGRGGNGAGSGWFFDPTPEESSEFQGSIVNAFSGDAHSGSPASGLGDFFTVAAAEITHVLGLYGSSLPLWSSRTTNTGIPDTAEGGGRGNFYVFQGPSIKHLLTSNNGGANGQNFGSAVHGAGPGVPVTFGGDTYLGAQDIGNAVYEFSRRYIPSNTFALMFKDAFSYSTVDPAQFGTFYANLNRNTGQLLVRGGANVSQDTVQIGTSGNVMTVSVDPSVDVAGTGALPGSGNLPAFVTQFDANLVTSIVIITGDGLDTISIDSLPSNVAVGVQSGSAIDVININGTSVGGSVSIDSGSGQDTINVNETAPGAPVLIQPNLNDDVILVNADGVGSAEVRYAATQRVASLTIGDGGHVTLTSGSNMVLTIANLSMSPGSRFDLFDNDLIIDYTGPSPLASIQSLLIDAYTNGAWNGDGILSSTAAADFDTALGYAEATDLFTAFPATFSGQMVDSTSILIKHTFYGDADLSGTVALDDFDRLAANFGTTGTRWSQGNFDFDNDTDLSDFSVLAARFGLSARSTASIGSRVTDDNDDKIDTVSSDELV